VTILPVISSQAAHAAKIDFLLNAKYQWFIDADLFFVQHVFMPRASGCTLIGLPNNTPNKAKYQERPTHHLICSGLFSVDQGDAVIKLMAENARDLWDKHSRPLEDERFINIAAMQCNVPILRLSTDWNWCGDNPPESVVAIHAAGRKDKYQWLKQVTKNYERTYLDK
jgi:hypothetical protein